MINKVVGYGAFKSYAEQPYPTHKQGKQLQLTNQIWSSTKRDADKIHPLDNYNHYHTIYKNNHLQNTQPADYHPQHVVRGANSTLNFAGTQSLSKAYDAVEAERDGQPDYKTGTNLLKTGVEHWKTNYQASIAQPIKLSQTTNNFATSQHSNFNQRSQSASHNQNNQQQLSKAASYKNRPYINDTPTGVTDYKFNYGQKIGSNPLQLLNRDTTGQPIRDHPLKHGTNQLWTQIPGYQGFKPSQIQIDQIRQKIALRKSVDKGNSKLNLSENYHVNIPGYAGYKPKVNVTQNKFRESCFSYKKD